MRDEISTPFIEVIQITLIEKPLLSSLREYLPLIIICTLYMIGSDIFSSYVYKQHPEFDFYFLSTIYLYIMLFYFVASICLVTFLMFYSIGYFIQNFHIKPVWRHFAVNIKNKFLTAQQFYGTLLIFLLILIFLPILR